MQPWLPLRAPCSARRRRSSFSNSVRVTWPSAAPRHLLAQPLGGRARSRLLGVLLDPPQARLEHGASLRQLADEQPAERVDRAADVLLTRVLEELQVHVLVLGERVAGAQELVGRLRHVGATLGEQELREQALALE